MIVLNMSKIYTLYHDNCPDGFGSALAAYLKFGDRSEYIGVKHQQDPPEMIAGSEVYILDFSYPRQVMEELLKQHDRVITLDHHKTAQEALLGLRGALFDMNRSGAMISWEYFHPDREIPDLFRYIQDRDLWQWKLADTAKIGAGLQLLPQEFELWSELLTPEGLKQLQKDGATILRYQTKEIKGMLKHVYLDSLPPYQASTGEWITGSKIPLINCSNYDIVSELCHKMLEEYPDYPVVASWLRGKSSVSYSLRSQPDFDCSEIAKRYGGGGHKNSAGFKLAI
jgi:uncharacterized protein